ncbi:hypothetical protein evm_012019 [Chilo suppressalis]|nr:hypothetical protein evm_012019 [Chilo suppressalis]
MALLEELSSTHVGCHIDDVCLNNISYADDMVLLSASVCGLYKLLSICERYALIHGLLYNSKKSECMVFQAGGGRLDYVPAIKLNGLPLQVVDRFKYLGHWVTADLKDDTDIERERRALSVRANMIAHRFARCSGDVKITLFRAFCTSFYTCSLWTNYTKKQYSALRVQYNNALRVFASAMFAQYRVDWFYTIMRKRCTSLTNNKTDSSIGEYGLVGSPLEVNISVTAIAFAPVESESKIIAIGFETGKIRIYGFSETWSLLREMDNSAAHHLTVSRLAFRPRRLEATRLELASCGADYFLRIHAITVTR